MAEKDLSWKFAEEYVVEGELIAAARAHSLEHGVEPISPAQGAQLAVIAAATNAKSLIEIGTGFGVSGLWMFTGAPGATLTSIDLEVEFQQSAKRAFADEPSRATPAGRLCGPA